MKVFIFHYKYLKVIVIGEDVKLGDATLGRCLTQRPLPNLADSSHSSSLQLWHSLVKFGESQLFSSLCSTKSR
jgi:hypothetical protein